MFVPTLPEVTESHATSHVRGSTLLLIGRMLSIGISRKGDSGRTSAAVPGVAAASDGADDGAAVEADPSSASSPRPSRRGLSAISPVRKSEGSSTVDERCVVQSFLRPQVDVAAAVVR